MSLIPPPAKWIGPAVAVLALSTTAALPLAVTATAAAVSSQQEQRAGEPQREPAVPLAGAAQPQDKPATQPPATQPATQPAEAPEPDKSFLEPLLAERFAELAQNRVRERIVTEPMWRQAAALLEAATRLAPREPRFHRLLVETRLKLGDSDGAIKALTAYRKADPYDRVAQIQLIDLYVARMQTADARLEYLRDLLSRSTVPAEVRSHVAASCVPLLMERSRDEAMAMLDEALRLFPLSPEALRLRYDMMGPDVTPPQRCAVLLSLLRSNPVQPDVVNELADLLASAGLAKDSIEWYSVALRLYPRLNRPYPDGFISDVGSQLMAAGQNESLETLLLSYLKARPDDADAWFMRLVKEKAAGDKANPQVVEDARQALQTRWAQLADRIAGREPQTQPQPQAQAQAGAAAGGPADAPAFGPRPSFPPQTAGAAAVPGAAPAASQPAPDPAEALAKIKSGDAEQWKPSFVNALSDLAWFELYFAEKPEAAAKWVGALKQVLPPDNVTVARLDGWLDLLQARPDDARAKLAPIADRDPLAALGLIRVAGSDAKAQADADDRAARLLADYPTGLVSAILRQGVAARNVKPPQRPAAADVTAELQKFPRDWMEIVNQPGSYYKLTADVLKVAHRYGEPLMGQITLTNITDYDLTIGPDGVLRPDLWFDAHLGGLANKDFPGVAYDRISRIVLLPARQRISQLVRLDQGDLGLTLAATPSVSTQVMASVVTNPITTANGIAPGPAGSRASFKAVSRPGFPLSQPGQRKRVLAALESGTTAEKLRNLELVGADIQLMAGLKQIDEPTRAVATEFANALNKTRDDTTPAVSAYAIYLAARLTSPESRGPLLERLLASDHWPARLLGLIASIGTGAERELASADKVAQNDADPTLKAFATATVDYLRNPPATQPTTQPAGGAGPPGTPPPLAPPEPGVGAGDASPIPSGLSVPSQPGRTGKQGG